jgi:hypothetical protein
MGFVESKVFVIDKLIKCYYDGRVIELTNCRSCAKHCSEWGYYEDGCLVEHLGKKPFRVMDPRKGAPFPK